MRKRKLGAILLSLLLVTGLLGGLLPAAADGMPVIGTLVITNTNNVNIRSGGGTSYGIVGKAAPGDIFEVVGVASSGWYQIVLDDGSTGYVSNNLVSYTPGTGLPTGGGTDLSQVRATVTISYRNEQGQILATDYVTLTYGSNTVSANDSKLPAGYTLISPRQATVIVSAQGLASPGVVVFTYRAGAQSGQVQLPIYYKDVFGALLNTGYAYLPVGSSLVAPNPALVPAGYSLVGPQDVVVSVSQYLQPNPASVSFLYARSQATPPPLATAMVPVFYRSNTGAYLNTAYLSLQTGSHTVTANNTLVPAGYYLISAVSVPVSVGSNGLANPGSVTFTYAQQATAAPVITPPPLKVANIPVYYRSVSGAQLNTVYVTVTQGTNTVAASDNNVPKGYTLSGARSQQVTVDANGVANPASLTFTYNEPAPPVTVNIPVVYRDHTGAQLNQTTVSVSSNIDNQVRADKNLAPAGYVLTSAGTVSVKVSPQGVPTPAQVVFTYQDPSTIQTPQMMPDFIKTSSNSGNYPVYTGPGENYYRVGNATLGKGSIRVYGEENGWVLIGYGTSNGGYRIGFVRPEAVPSNVVPPTMILVRMPHNSVSNSKFVDDPIVAKNRVLDDTIPGGSPYTVLAYLNDFWAYVEIDNYENSGKAARGFVSRRSLGLQ